MFCRVSILGFFISDEGSVIPNGLPVFPPVTSKRPSRQRFPRIPFALPPMQQSSGSKFLPQPEEKVPRKFEFLRADCGEIPFRAIHVVDGNKGWLAPHRETHIVGLE